MPGVLDQPWRRKKRLESGRGVVEVATEPVRLLGHRHLHRWGHCHPRAPALIHHEKVTRLHLVDGGISESRPARSRVDRASELNDEREEDRCHRHDGDDRRVTRDLDDVLLGAADLHEVTRRQTRLDGLEPRASKAHHL